MIMTTWNKWVQIVSGSQIHPQHNLGEEKTCACFSLRKSIPVGNKD